MGQAVSTFQNYKFDSEKFDLNIKQEHFKSLLLPFLLEQIHFCFLLCICGPFTEIAFSRT